ncbi:MAG: DUF998 domain-containing protein [Anaerolineales bacterium]|nr:DUF998 domain-containing protein [Anaerolineales bacterium]
MKPRPFLIAVIFFIVVIVIAHFFAPLNYRWEQNTISDLGSQGHVYKWIMQAGFIGFGLILTAGVYSYFRQNNKLYFLLFIAIYGLSILMSGIFCAASIDPAISYSVQEASLHSLFATLAGVAMSLGIFWQTMTVSTSRERRIRLVFLLLIGGISGLFGLAENHVLVLDKGIIQRILYLVGLTWLVYEERILVSEGIVK